MERREGIIDNSKGLVNWRPTMWEFPSCCFDCGEFKLRHPNNHSAYPLKMNRCCSDCNLRVEEERKKMMMIRKGGWTLNKAYPI